MIKFGWAEESITPSKKVSLMGQFAERISQYVEKPIVATALAIDGGDNQAVFCTCDLVSVGWNLVKSVREKIDEANIGLKSENVILNAIHTHTGPGYGETKRSTANDSGFSHFIKMLEEFLSPGQKYVESAETTNRDDVATDAENFEFLSERIAAAIINAWNSRDEGSFSNAFGRAVTGLSRRAVYFDNTGKMWGDTCSEHFYDLEGGSDSGIELLYVFDKSDKLTGIIINLACPAQCVQHRLFVSPDFWGEVRVNLRKHFGEHIFILAQCSAAGDQCPVDLVRWVEPESELNDPNISRNNPPKRKADPSMFDLSGMRTVGRRISNEVILVYEDGLCPPKKDAEFVHTIHDIELPLRKATKEDIEEARKSIKEYLSSKKGNVDFNDVANLLVHLGVLDRAKLQESMTAIPTEMHYIRLGTVAFATNPFELFLTFGNRIKARSNAEQTFIVQLANGQEGYVPTKEAEIHGHYSAFISSGQVGHEGGDILVTHTVDAINDIFKLV